MGPATTVQPKMPAPVRAAPRTPGPIVVQRVRRADYIGRRAGDVRALGADGSPLNNVNGLTDLQNATIAIDDRITANRAQLDDAHLWDHLDGSNHTALVPVGNASTFCTADHATILGYIHAVIQAADPVWSADNDRHLVYEVANGVCQGRHAQGVRTGCRVVLDLTNATEQQILADNVGRVLIHTAYPI